MTSLGFLLENTPPVVEDVTTMSLAFRIVLIVVSVLVVLFALRKIRKAQLAIDDAIFWIICSVFLLVLAIFPKVTFFATELLGIHSPANLVFLVMIFIVIVKLFNVSIELSVQKHRLNYLVQKLALVEHGKKKTDKPQGEKTDAEGTEEESAEEDSEGKE